MSAVLSSSQIYQTVEVNLPVLEGAVVPVRFDLLPLPGGGLLLVGFAVVVVELGDAGIHLQLV